MVNHTQGWLLLLMWWCMCVAVCLLPCMRACGRLSLWWWWWWWGCLLSWRCAGRCCVVTRVSTQVLHWHMHACAACMDVRVVGCGSEAAVETLP